MTRPTPPSAVSDAVERPIHYTSHASGIECIQITEALPFNLGNAVKYVWRADLKGGGVDLEKALFYLRRERRFASGFNPPTYRKVFYERALFYRHDVRQLLLRVSEHGADPLRTVVDALASLLGGGLKPVECLDRCIAAVEAEVARRAA